MSYEFSGTISVSNTGKKNAYSDVANKLLQDADFYECYNKYLEDVDFSSGYANVYGRSSFDDMDAMSKVFDGR